MNQTSRILMVEDSASLAAVYQAYLEDTEFQVLTVETLSRAHASLSSFRPDIVLLDIELPDGNGMDFLVDIRSQDTPPRVIVMTAHGSSDMAVEAMRQGAFDFLTKPFDAARGFSTLSEIREAAEKRQIERALAKTAGHIKDAARLLNISRTTLWEKMTRFGIGTDLRSDS